MPDSKKLTAHDTAKYTAPYAPNNSKLIKIEASGQLVTPQNIELIPTAAPSADGRPITPESVAPKVAPIKSVGTISPPLYPAATVITVRINF